MPARAASILLLSLGAAGPAFGQSLDEAWGWGEGMGAREAIVEHGPGNQIMVACPLISPGPQGISFRLMGDPPPDGTVQVMFDGETPFEFGVDERGYVRPGCTVCDQLFLGLIEGFRTHESVWVNFGGGIETTFTLTGAAEAIGDCPIQDPS